MVALRASGETTLRICVVLIVVATLAVVLRLITKLRTKAALLTEDWMIIFALALFYVYNGVLLGGVLDHSAGGSLDLTQLTIPQQIFLLKYLYLAEIFFTAVITAAKLSVLFFYRTIFATPLFRRATAAVGAACLLWFASFLFFITFQCRPVKAAWDQSLLYQGKAHCMPIGTLIFAYELMNCCIDICMLCLPIYMIRKLQLPRRKKVTVSGVFLLGGFVCITSVARMAYVFDPRTGAPRNLPAMLDWSTIQLGSAIACACLPTYGPLVPMATDMLSGLLSWSSSKLYTLRYPRSSGSEGFHVKHRPSKQGSFDKLEETNSSQADARRRIKNANDDRTTPASYRLDYVTPQTTVEHV
ncbi:MAG: hypothetical protein Q9178_007505 [Gyalolechia marmorata]